MRNHFVRAWRVLREMERPHIVMLPISGQGHINPMLHLAKLLHSKGFYITFINTESSKQSILGSHGPDSLRGLDSFRFESIPDGLLSPDSRSQESVTKWCLSTYDNCAAPLRELLVMLNGTAGVPRISCVVYNWIMSFALDVADELGIPALVFSTMSACGFMADLQLDELIRRGYTPLRDESYLTNGYLDTTIDWIPGMKDIRIRDLPSYVRTIDSEDFFLSYGKVAAQGSLKAKGLILNTFDLLEADVVNALKPMFPNVYTIGPLHTMLGQAITEISPIKSLRLNLWGEDHGYMQWLNKQQEGSVIYVNFGSIATVSHEQIIEFAWGLANSNRPFLWVIRPDLVNGDHVVFPEEFVEGTKGRCYLASWCSQEEVLSHASVGGFLTHCGWNSTLESICSGVPMMCWPGFADQCTNTRYVCKGWGIGMEIDKDVVRDQVTTVVKELMEGEKGGEMRKNVLKWKEGAKLAIMHGGSSYENLVRFTKDLNAMKMGSS